MGAVPAQILVCRIWSPPDVYSVRGYSGKRPRWFRQPRREISMQRAKFDLRNDLRCARQEFVKKRYNSAFYVDDQSRSIFAASLKNATSLAAYCSVGGEADPSLLVRIARDAGMTIALPCVDTRDARIVFRLWNEDEVLERSPLGFLQPHAGSRPLAPTIILTPLLAFDRALNRLGQGAGHYDRAFADYPDALRIGVAWSVQEVPTVPVDAWDVPLDAVITEQEWITAPHTRIGKDG